MVSEGAGLLRPLPRGSAPRRRGEHGVQAGAQSAARLGDRTLVGTKYLWLENPASMKPARRTLLSRLKDICTCIGRAWALKEAASRLWDYASIGLGAEGLARVGDARLAEQARADGARGADGQDPPRGDPECGGAEGDERRGGVEERADPADQVDGLRLKEPRALP